MTEREKMLSGAPYNSRDPELIAMYHRARALLRELNRLASTRTVRKQALLEELLGRVGEGVWLEPPFYCDYGAFIQLGAGTFVNATCMLQDNNHIILGKQCLLGPGVHIYTAMHPIEPSERIHADGEVAAGAAPYRTFSRPVHIGERAWLGGGVIVMPGVTIGAESVVGAGSVVTRDLPGGVVAAGSPCRVLRKVGG